MQNPDYAAINLKPYQGLKLFQATTKCDRCHPATINLKPYQGLKYRSFHELGNADCAKPQLT